MEKILKKTSFVLTLIAMILLALSAYIPGDAGLYCFLGFVFTGIVSALVFSPVAASIKDDERYRELVDYSSYWD